MDFSPELHLLFKHRGRKYIKNNDNDVAEALLSTCGTLTFIIIRRMGSALGTTLAAKTISVFLWTALIKKLTIN